VPFPLWCCSEAGCGVNLFLRPASCLLLCFGPYPVPAEQRLQAAKIFMPAGAKKPIYAPYVEHLPPDVTAGIFWMKNRGPAEWRDAWQIEHSLGKYIISDKPMSEEQWTKERATLHRCYPRGRYAYATHRKE
jgi:hypothetical protein